MGKYFNSNPSSRRLSDSAKLRQYEKENNIVNPRSGANVSLTNLIDSQASVLKSEGKKQMSDKLSKIKSPTEIATDGMKATNLQEAKKATDKTLGVEKSTEGLNLLKAADYYLGMEKGYVSPNDTGLDIAKKAIGFNAAGVKDAERYVGKAADYDGDGKISIKDTTKLELDNETKAERFVRENIPIDVSEIIHSDEYKIGESYLAGLDKVSFEDALYLSNENKKIMTYLIGRKLKENKYDVGTAKVLSMDDIISDLENSGDIYDDVERYLTATEEERNKREAEAIFEQIKGKPVLEVLEMLNRGLIDNPEGIYRSLAFGKDNTSYTVGDYLTQMIDEDLAGRGAKLPDWLSGRSVGQMAGSLAQSFGQMVPSMALKSIPYAGEALSSVSFGMSAGGNAKVELMREGYDEKTATIYGMLVGSAEAGLEKLMGSIPGLGSSLRKNLTKGIKNAVLRAVADYGFDIVSEAAEESVQEIIEPALRRLAGIDPEEIEKIDWSEVAYAGIQGAIMAGGTNTVSESASLIKDLSPNFENPTIENYKALDELISKGLEGDVKSDFYKESKRLNGMIQKSYDGAIAEGKSAEVAAVESIRGLTINDVARVLTAQEKTMRKAMKAEVKAQKAEAKAKVKAETSVKGAESSPVDTAEIKTELPMSAVKTEGAAIEVAKLVPAEITSDNAARTRLHKNGIAAQVKSSNETVGIVGVEYSDGEGKDNVTYRTSEGKVIKGGDLEFDLDYMGYIIKTAGESLPAGSANAMIKAADVYREYAGNNASSDKLISSFMDLREAAVRGMTFEQASNDIRLSGDVSQLGEAAARIAINDGLTVYTQEQAKAEKAKTDKKAEHKKAVPVKGAVRVAEDVKVTSSMKANMPILKRIARSGNVAVVIEKFSGADKYSKGFYTGGVIHLNAERLTEGGFTYTGIHESVHFVKHLNLEGYKAIEKFVENYYKEKGVDIEAEIKATQNLYKQRGQELTPEEAMEEIVCNTLSDIATDGDALTAFMGLDSKAQNRFIEALKAIAKKLKEWATKHLKGTEYHSIVINDADTLISLAKKLRSELETAGQKNNTADNGGEVKYDITKDISGKDVVVISADILKGVKQNQHQIVANEIASHIGDYYKIIESGYKIYIGADLPGEYTQSVYTRNLLKYNKRILKAKNLAASNLGEMIEIATDKTWEANQKSKHKIDAKYGWYRYSTRFAIPVYDSNSNIISYRIYGAKLLIRNDANGKKYLYDILDIKKENSSNLPASWLSKTRNNISSSPKTTVPQNVTTVNTNSMQNSNSNSHSFARIDEEYLSAVESGNTVLAQRLVDEAAESAMKDSKIRDESGKLVKVYHGSDSEDFYEFDKQRRGQTDSSMYGRGYYFAFDSDYASDFGENIREFYVDIKKPYYIDVNAPASKIANFLKSKGIKVDFDYRNMKSHYFAKNFGSQKFADTLVGLEFDGVIVRTDEGDYFEAVAFHRNQMKLADAVTYDNEGNVIPISERFNLEKKDIRYSFGEEDLDLGLYISEKSEVAEHLKVSNAAVGNILESIKSVKIGVYEISRILKRNLKDFGVVGDISAYDDRIAEILNIAEKDSFVDGGAVVGEFAVTMKDAIKHSDFAVDNFKEEREDILSRIKSFGKIYLTEDQVAMLEEYDYNLNWFKQKMFGKVTVVKKPKTAGNIESLNTLWHSLSEAYPQWFSADTLSDNMPIEMIRALRELKPQSVTAEDYFIRSNDEVAIELANRVLSDIINYKYKKLENEQLKAKVKALKEKQSDNMKKWLLKKDAGDKLNNIERYAASFYKKLTKPNKNESIPENLRKPLLEMLEGLNFIKGTLHKGQPIKHDQIWQVRMKVVAEALQDMGGLKNEDGNVVLKDNKIRGFEVDGGLILDLNEFALSGAKDVYEMTDEEILKLNNLMYRLRNEISQMHKLNANKFKAQVQELGQATVSELKAKGENKLLKSKANKLMFYSTADALTYFSQFGEAGMSVYEELREGYDKYILNLDKVRRFTEGKLDEKKIKEWSKESFDFDLKSGDKVTLTIPQLMTLYLLDKRKQARGHLYDNPDKRGRITVIDSKGNKNRVTVDNDDIILMTAKLKPEQIKCAEVMQGFLENEVAEWGNEITMRRYLYRAFTTKNYFPIKVDGVSLDTTDATASIASFYAVANPGFSKRTQEGAHKPLIIDDVFDVFAEHCGNMAIFNGMSEALSDAMRWYNFRSGESGVKEAIDKSLSEEGTKWFERFIQDLNGRGQKASDFDKTIKKVVGVTKSSLIWGNMKVVLQQPTAYLRALSIIDLKYLADPRVFKKGGVEKAMKHCPTAMYKSWGFYTTDVGRSARNLILNTGTVYDKAKDVGFFLAGKADELTWGRLWNACELQVLDTTELTRNSEGFNEAVAELLRKVIDETQVVDTPFHRSQVRRDTSGLAQLYSAFMDEPIKAYNMFMRAFQSGDGKKILRTAVAFTTTVVVGQALVKALWDLFVRYNPEDDEDGERNFEDFLRLYGKSVIDEMNPLNLHPLLTKLSEAGESLLHKAFPNNPLFEGVSYGSSSLDTMAINDFTNAFGRIIKAIRGEDTNRTWYGYVYDISKVLSDVSGIGVNRVVQDFVGIINNFLPANVKVTKTEYSNSFAAKSAVESLLKGNKRDYERWHKELNERYKGDTAKIQSALGSALSKSGNELVKNAYTANTSGNKAARDEAYRKLEALGFEFAVIKRGVASYESTYNNYVKKAAQAQIDGEKKIEQEALGWIKEQGVFNDKFEDDISLKKSELEENALREAEPESAYETQFLINALKSGDMESYEEAYEELVAECKNAEEESKLRTKVKSAITTNYKYDYWLAYRDSDQVKLKEIERVLKDTELYEGEIWDTTKEWVKENIRSCYESAVSTNNLEDMNYYKRLLLRSGVYSSEANAYKALDSWRESQQKKK